MTLNAQSLYYAIIVSVIISLTCGLLVMLSRLQIRQLEADLQFQQWMRNLESGITLLLTGLPEAPGSRTVDLFGNGTDLVQLTLQEWGLFEVGTVRVLRPDGTPVDSLQRSMLTGAHHNPTLHTAIYLPDLQQPLVLAGQTIIRGIASLPKAGVRRGKGNTASPLIQGALTTSGPLLPATGLRPVKQIPSLHSASGQEYTPGVSIVRSFLQPARYLHIPGGYLRHEKITGHVVVYAPERLTVGADCQLEDVILCAPVIAFEDGFQGSVQALANRQITTGNNCRFNYPSALAVSPQPNESEAQPEIRIRAGSRISGCIRIEGTEIDRAPPLLVLEEGTTVTGQVWVEGEVDLRGSVTGNVTCHLLVRQEADGRYRNLLKDATIDRTALPDPFVAPVIFSGKNNKRKIVKWLP